MKRMNTIADYDSIVVELDEVDGLGARRKIERIAREQNILRVKGYAAVKGKPMRL